MTEDKLHMLREVDREEKSVVDIADSATLELQMATRHDHQTFDAETDEVAGDVSQSKNRS